MNAHAPSDRLLRKREVAELWACSNRTIERVAAEGKLTKIKIRGGVRFRESEVRKVIHKEDGE